MNAGDGCIWKIGLLLFTCSLCCACQALGDTYKWMLYGDDDTLFFVDAVLDLLQLFDPELPYAISDNIWFEANSALVRGCPQITGRDCTHDVQAYVSWPCDCMSSTNPVRTSCIKILISKQYIV